MDCCKLRILKYLGILVILVVFLVGCICLYDKVIDEVTYKPRFEQVSYSSRNINGGQTARLDSLERIVTKIDGEYVSSIDLMINKLNTWLGFWMGILTIVLLVITFWQYLKIERYDERVSKLEEQNQAAQVKLVKNADKINKRLLENEQKMKAQIAMLSSMLNLTNITDPMLLSDSQDRNIQQRYYMSLLRKSFQEYISIIDQKFSSHTLDSELIDQIPMILLNLRIALVKCQATFTVNPRMSILYYELMVQFKSVEKEIRQSSQIDNVTMRHLNQLVRQNNTFEANFRTLTM